LQFLSEADLADSRMDGVPANAASLFEAIADDPLAREQYLDFFRNRTFRRTLLCRAQRRVERAIADVHLERFAVSCAARPLAQAEGDGRETFATPDGACVTTSEPALLAALRELAGCWPVALDFPELARRALGAAGGAPEPAAARLRAVLLEAHAARVVQLHSTPPPVAAAPGERPRASPLARAQCAAGLPVVSSLLHANAGLEGELEPWLLPMIDGTRDRRELDGLAPASAAPGVDAALARFAALGLLAAGDQAG
jgi:hypothetical protein